MAGGKGIAILGIYVADTAYLAGRMPKVGETILGSGFSLGPGGKGSNQSVAAGRAGGKVSFISKIGDDPFGKMALEIYAETGVTPRVEVMAGMPSGAAFIFVNDQTGENAIIVYPGAAGTISIADVEAHRAEIENAAVFVTQLEQPADAALAALRIARNAGVTTVFNPAPANPFDDESYGLCDFFVPNESEAAAIVGFAIETEEDARRAGEEFLKRGVKTALITLGEKGVYIHSAEMNLRIPAISAAPAIDTAGAGDAFIGGLATALSEGREIKDAVRFGCATAGIAVTRRGTAPAMPERAEIEALLEREALV
ncbi:ribokinase [Roseibium sediminicola]|uniref:Ribokinase n=1 Tax=Roseibium sediminicola TaxID=2933272 RepID=A0ABT0GZX5_9HYPH|nr:ribokinase [Roseibium sp. CAU 1639]MCK7614994.1 ribokinase [Roseibium sp. CAU 1639]